MKTVERSQISSTGRSKCSPRGEGGWVRRAGRICLMAAIIGFVLPLQAQLRDLGGKQGISFYTANAYIGSDYARVLLSDPSDVTNLLLTVGQVYGEILASDPPKRMAGLADEIIRTRPDAVGLEELWTVEKAVITAPQGAAAGQQIEFRVDYDFLQLLTNALAAKGAHYRVAVLTSEQDLAMPMFDLQTGALAYARVVDHEAILMRTDLPPGFLNVGNPQAGHFATHLSIPTFGIDIVRGWCSVDVFTRGQRFLLICTHLEDEMAPPIQEAQGLELLAGPANVNTPVVIVGDFNADPLHRTGTTTYDAVVAAGFKDAWQTLHPHDPAGGLTWGHDPYLADPATAFNRRIDYVFYRGNMFAPTSTAIMDSRISLTEPPLWPSDHAALTASFLLGNGKSIQNKAVAGRR
jgi:hypothetical protein